MTAGNLAGLSRTPRSLVLAYLENLSCSGMLRFVNDEVSADSRQRITLSIEALKQGADPESVSRKLNWQEFEEVTFIILDSNDYCTKKHFIFGNKKARREIDVVGVKRDIVLCIDCKHWTHGWQRSRIINAIKNQVERTKALAAEAAKHKQELMLKGNRAIFIPSLVTLADVSLRTVHGVPVVPILRMKTFLSELSDMTCLPLQCFRASLED